MSVTRMARTLAELFHYLGPEEVDQLPELLMDVCEGAELLDSHTKELVGKLIAEMPEPDNFTTMDLAEEIRKIGTEYAVQVANDLESMEAC